MSWPLIVFELHQQFLAKFELVTGSPHIASPPDTR